MTDDSAADAGRARRRAGPHRVRLPGFVSDADIGLGEVVSRMTSFLGIAPCGPCHKRAERLNEWTVFSGRRQPGTGHGGSHGRTQ